MDRQRGRDDGDDDDIVDPEDDLETGQCQEAEKNFKIEHDPCVGFAPRSATAAALQGH
jgi:hypothetical protein